MIRPRWLIGAAMLAFALPAQAQLNTTQSWLSLIDIPLQVVAARNAGTTQGEIASVIGSLLGVKATPQEIDTVFYTRTQVVRQNGPTGNFGSFVQSQLARGLRGRELAQAIHDEHALEKQGYSPNHPGIDSVYVNGHWLYRVNTYVVNGKTVTRPHVVLVNGYWVPQGNPYFTSGHWVVPAHTDNADAEHHDENDQGENQDHGDKGKHGGNDKADHDNGHGKGHDKPHKPQE